MVRNNKGSTLITVIVAISFVTILASIILGTSVVNMSMKGIDRKVKDDFYYAERGMSDVFTGVGQVAAEEAGEAYDKAFKGLGVSYETGEEAYKKFKEQFLTGCFDEFDETDDDDRIALFNKYVVSSFLSSRIKQVTVVSADKAVYKLTDETTTEDDPAPDGSDLDDYVAVVIPNVSVAAVDKNDYRSVVTTDIVIECPTVDFLGTNAEITDYAIIGCQGVYFKGGDTVLSGNLYGGVHKTPNTEDSAIHHSVTPGVTPLYGGINVNGSTVTLKSNYVVSKGDINVLGNASSLTVESSNTSSGIPSVWFDSFRTIKPSGGSGSATVNINNASVFALNDLELNSNDSVFKIKGDYYGYNDKTISGEKSLAGALANAGNSLDYTDDRVDNDSSAILINGNHCSLDLTEAHTLVLMGKAFIDFSSKGNIPTTPTAYPKIAATAEALALQPNQQLYLVPTDFMTSPNPATAANYPATGFEMNKKRSELDNWFGYKYVKTSKTWGDDEIVDDIFDTYAVDLRLPEGGTERVYYAYLKFNDKLWIKNEGEKYEIAKDEYGNEITKIGTKGSVSSKAAFFDEIMSSTGSPPGELQPTAYRLREKIIQSIRYNEHFNLQNAKINSSSTAVIYGRNAIVNYDITNGQYGIKSNTEGLERFADYPENLFKRYQLLCVFLDGREDSTLGGSISFDALEAPKIASDWKINKTGEGGAVVPITSPMDNFVLLSEMTNADLTKVDTTYNPSIAATANNMYIGKDAANQAFGQCIIVTKAAGTSYEISGNFKGVAFVDGDVVIASGAQVDGLVMATGTITINGGSTKISANKGLIQSRIDKELSLVEKGTYDYEDNFLIKYLTNDGASRMYSVTKGSKREENRIKPDYNSFMHYENWRKGNI